MGWPSAPPSLKPRPRLLLTPTCCTADTGSDTGATEATMVSATTDTVLATTARGLRLSPRPRLLPTPTCCTVDTATTDSVSAITDTVSATTDTVSATTARGLLRPST